MTPVHWVDPRHDAVICGTAWFETRRRGYELLTVRDGANVTCPDCRERVQAAREQQRIAASAVVLAARTPA